MDSTIRLTILKTPGHAARIAAIYWFIAVTLAQNIHAAAHTVVQ
jgi:hypothetical protein